MKKIREGKENKRNGANFFKYIHPQPSTQTKIHSRSLIELEPNTSRYQQSARIPSSRDIHHSSVCGVSQGVEADTIKSNSLKKFLSIFGGPANLNNNSCGRSSGRGDQKSTQKTSGRQVFTCNIKNVNVNVTNSKEKDMKDHRSLLVMKRDKMENNFQTHHQPLNRAEQQENTILQLRKNIDQSKETQLLIRKQLQQLIKENSALKRELNIKQQENQILVQKMSQREGSLSKKIQQLQNSLASKEKCRQHELIIQSLKKVINQQLRKIIQLQKSKIERQEIEKLEERINKNISLANENSVKQKLKLIENEGNLKMKRKEGTTIKIEDESFESAVSSPSHELQTYQDTIEQATQEEERGSQSKNKEPEQGDSILEQVDKYLALWRSKS